MYEIRVECGSCEQRRTIRCDASGIADGIPMRCPACERSHPHRAVTEPVRIDDASPHERAMGAVDETKQNAQSGAYSAQ